jgi:hypothetical protein
MNAKHHLLASLILVVMAASCLPDAAMGQTPPAFSGRTQTRIDWAKFLERLDPVSEVLPSKCDDGTFVGNGMLGLTVYRDGAENRLRFDVGRGDVTDRRSQYSNQVGRGRLPIGYFTLTPEGQILEGEARIDLWNAEDPRLGADGARADHVPRALPRPRECDGHRDRDQWRRDGRTTGMASG